MNLQMCYTKHILISLLLRCKFSLIIIHNFFYFFQTYFRFLFHKAIIPLKLKNFYLSAQDNILVNLESEMEYDLLFWRYGDVNLKLEKYYPASASSLPLIPAIAFQLSLIQLDKAHCAQHPYRTFHYFPYFLPLLIVYYLYTS
mgnify:CR=1 FL=1